MPPGTFAQRAKDMPRFRKAWLLFGLWKHQAWMYSCAVSLIIIRQLRCNLYSSLLPANFPWDWVRTAGYSLWTLAVNVRLESQRQNQLNSDVSSIFRDAKDSRLLRGHQISVQALKWWKISTVTARLGLLEDQNHVVCCGWGARHSVGHSLRQRSGEVPSEMWQVDDSWVCLVSLCHPPVRLLQLLTAVCWHRAFWIR